MIEGIWHCGYCGMDSTKEGHDGCLGELIGVANACCGHGEPNKAYVQFYDGTAIRGDDAIAIFEILKRNSNPYLDMNQTHEERYNFLTSAARMLFTEDLMVSKNDHQKSIGKGMFDIDMLEKLNNKT